MPKRDDISSILIIGAGPIIIGQACEFDYSGTQATRALKEEGYRVVLVNSNPATIMTDPNLADATYIEPLTVDYLESIIVKEKPDAILPTVGGQTALNLAMDLKKSGLLDKHGIKLIGAKVNAIEKAENNSPAESGEGGGGAERGRAKGNGDVPPGRGRGSSHRSGEDGRPHPGRHRRHELRAAVRGFQDSARHRGFWRPAAPRPSP